MDLCVLMKSINSSLHIWTSDEDLAISRYNWTSLKFLIPYTRANHQHTNAKQEIKYFSVAPLLFLLLHVHIISIPNKNTIWWFYNSLGIAVVAVATFFLNVRWSFTRTDYDWRSVDLSLIMVNINNQLIHWPLKNGIRFWSGRAYLLKCWILHAHSSFGLTKFLKAAYHDLFTNWLRLDTLYGRQCTQVDHFIVIDLA